METKQPCLIHRKSLPFSQHANHLPVIYDALVIGGGPAGLSSALILARVCRTSMVFDSGEYRNNDAKEMHTFLSRDGIAPRSFRNIARGQIREKYSDQVSFMDTKIVSVSNTEILPGYKGFQAVDSSNNTYLGRKLVLAMGVEDILPTNIEGYKENWPQHMQVVNHYLVHIMLTLAIVTSVLSVTGTSRKISPSAGSRSRIHPMLTSPDGPAIQQGLDNLQQWPSANR